MTVRLPLRAALAALALAGTLALLAEAHRSSRGLDALGVALAAAASLPLLAQRRAPLAVFAATTLASAALMALGYAQGPPIGATVALFLLATREPRREHAAAIVALFALHVGATTVGRGGFPTDAILFGALFWGGAWVLGDRVRQRGRRLERERRIAVAEERTRIARDLHDSAAHAINVILVQAGAARLLRDRDPEAAQAALRTIEDVARDTIGEIDALVRGLREGDRAAEPAGLAGLDTLAARHRGAGLDLDVHVEGPRRALPPAVDQAAYRILQESLTNAARHGSGRAEVRVDYGDGALALSVVNPVAAGAARAAAEDRHGLLGMRERAAVLGGELEAGREDGHFRIRARLPYAEAAR